MAGCHHSPGSAVLPNRLRQTIRTSSSWPWPVGEPVTTPVLLNFAVGKRLMLEGNQVESILQDYDSSDIEQIPLFP